MNLKRRTFIALLGGTTACPLAARAQQPAMPVVGFLHPSSPSAETYRLRAFRQGLKEAGLMEGENVNIEYRWADNQLDRLPTLATELVQRRVAVIATAGIPSIVAAKAATTTTPVVFVVAEDPVALGLVSSLARPGGNLTGINILATELAAKRLELLRELVPGAARVAVLVNPANAATIDSTLKGVEAAAGAMRLQINVLNASTIREIDAALATVESQRADALFVTNDPFLLDRRVQLAMLAVLHRVPAIYQDRLNAEVGGLVSYGPSVADAFRQIGAYAGRILRGAKPADLPVVQSTKFELVINTSTARMLGLTVPETLLARADEVIE
jgi:putative tryptophan/tyrosine transport system substrate-binding protein